MTETSFMALLTLRSQWEIITRRYNIPDNNGTIDNLNWFITNGYRSNHLRKNFNTALEIANTIIEENEKYYEQNPNLSSVCWKKVQAL